MSEHATILLVDDSKTNLEVLSHYLSTYSYRLLFAASGERALEIAFNTVPDLILLDIMLPGIDGYEACEKIKASPKTAHVPVLFLSALDKVSDKVKGFKAGGVDYISKPFQKEELIARVQTHIELHRIREENRSFALEMEALAEARAKALIHADRLATLGTLSAGVAHEINNPATFISVGIQTIDRLWNDVLPALNFYHEAMPEKKARVVFAQTHVPTLIDNVKTGVARIQKVVGGLKSYSHAGSSNKVLFDINKSIIAALDLCFNRLKYNVTVVRNLAPALPFVSGDAMRIEQVFVNLFVNAADSIEVKGKGELTIFSRTMGPVVQIVVEDTGPGLPQTGAERIWEPFFSTKDSTKGTGLGLSISKGIIEEHSGTIRAENREQGGARFVIELPAGKN